MPFYKIEYNEDEIKKLLGNDECTFNKFLKIFAKDEQAAHFCAKEHVKRSKNIDSHLDTEISGLVALDNEEKQKYYRITQLTKDEVSSWDWERLKEKNIAYTEVLNKGELIKLKKDNFS